MDVKRITWVGNVYQKFEAMCLEVEEVMYQDTVKYVENQVQTVGASVKRFCSDVMQDLLSPSSLDSQKVSPFCFTVEQDSDDGMYKKPNVSKKKELSKADNVQLTGSLKETSDTSEDVSVAPLIQVRLDVDNLCRPSGDFAKGAYSGLRSRKRHDQSKYNSSTFGLDQNRGEDKDKLNSNETSCATSPEKYLNRASLACGEHANEICEASRGQTATVTTPSTSENSRSHSMVESCGENENASRFMADLSNDFQSSNEIVVIESIGNNGKETKVPEFHGISAELKDADMCLYNWVASIEGTSQNEEARYDNYADEEIFVPRPSQQRKLFDWNLASDIETDTEHGAETIQKSDKTKLEETIVVVNEDDLCFLPQTETKKRPYKKKIREALYSRMRSGRKHEYEQLALQYGDGKNLNHECVDTLTPTFTVDGTKKLLSSSCESEWELL